MNSGYVSRSIRVSNRKEPNTSARFPRPTANVPAKSPTLVYPCCQFVPRRYALTEKLPLGSTSPVGTYQIPVSPKNVVVAGLVSVSELEEVGCEEAEPVCAFAAPVNSRQAAATVQVRNAIVITLYLPR